MDKIIKLREHLKEAATKQSGEWLRIYSIWQHRTYYY